MELSRSTPLIPTVIHAPVLSGRGLSPKLGNRNYVTELESPRDVWRVLSDEFSENALRAAGLLSRQGRFLFYRHHLLFFHVADGELGFITARDITGESRCKELSLAGLHSPFPYLFDALQGRPEHVLVCEGCIDTLSATQLGYAAVGVPGVVGFREEWFSLFRGVGRVTVLFDNDAAGRRQGMQLRSRFRRRRIQADAMFPAQGKDVNELLTRLQKEGLV